MTEHGSAAAGGGEEDADGLPRKKFSGKKLIMFVVLPILLLVGGGAGLYFSGILDSLLGTKPKVDEHAEHAPPVVEPESVDPVFFDIPDIMVNLNSTSKRSVFLKVSISIQIGRESDKDALTKVMPRIIDNFQVYLRELRLEDLRGSAGIYRLREELLTRVSLAAQPIKIKDVLFKEMLIQ
ncbi:flagellar FliL protein [uncultured Gammaproteobacteria bacterium]